MNKDELKEKVVDYASKVFFYCVKRCNSRIDAEDLSQTILLEILSNIDKGARINDMDYYVWGVCKNQYNMYLRKTIKERNSLEFKDDIDEADNSKTTLDKMLEDEKVRRINGAVKLLSKDYAEILYAYYVEDKTLRFIAEELNIPLGTVGRRLSDIRQKLKYLDMEKLNGKKAYVPKDFSAWFGMMKIGTYNPHNYVNTLINKNLLYHSYNNPCTIEDYSIELGISRPYVEDIVDQLVKVTLLKKVDNNKYITNFPFFTYHDFKKVRKLSQSTELDIVKEKLQIIIDKLNVNMKGYLPKYLEDYSNSLLSNQLWDIQGLVIKAFSDVGLLDNKENEEFFPYNLILITSDINKIYEK